MSPQHELDVETKEVHYNLKQRISQAVRAHIEVWIAARAFGKTRGIIAPRAAHNAYALERSLGGYIVPTIKKFKQNLAQSLIKGLHSLGYKEDVDYVHSRPPPKAWARPHNEMLDYEYCFSWSNGSAISFLSQQASSAGVGGSFDYTIVDEARLIKPQPLYEDYFPAVRGNIHHFGGMAEHQSLLITTDRPRTKEGRWVYRYKSMVTPEINEAIMQLNWEDSKLERALYSGELAPTTQEKYRQLRNRYARQLNELRLEAVYYGEASVLDNIQFLGEAWLRQRIETEPESVLRTAYLNEDIDTVQGAYYQGLSDRHCYLPGVNATLHSRPVGIIYTPDSSEDAEIDPDLPLDIACDYGSNINCMAIGQAFDDLFRVDNAMHVLRPQLTYDLAQRFILHYRPHRNKSVNYYIDHTARHTGGQSPFSYEQIVSNALRAAGWQVNVIYIGQQPNPHWRYLMWQGYLKAAMPSIMFNAENCDDLLTSMRLCEIEERDGQVKKKKSGEGKGPLEEEVLLPHYTDALDTLVYGRLHVLPGTTGSPVPMVTV